MALVGSERAYTWARSGIARSGATRSNYVQPYTTVELILRDALGNITSRTDLTPYIRFGSLDVTEAINDEPDTCSFQIVPTAPAAAVPKVGQEIAVAWTPGATLFRGYALVVQFDRRARNESPWVSVQCQDSMWRFDARIVTYRFPAQSVTESVRFLVANFCNDPATPTAVDFRVDTVQAGMPNLAAFDVINQRPSTVMRRLLTAVAGGFYIDGRDVHAWAGSLSEPAQTHPQPLTNTLESLKAFRVTHDATQLRKRVLVEGQRTQTLIPLLTHDVFAVNAPIGIPLDTATFFDASLGVDYQHIVRIGTQWAQVQTPVSANGQNPFQTRLVADFTPADAELQCEALSTPPPFQGWIRIGNQYAAYISSSTAGSVLSLRMALPEHPYGQLTVPMATGETVEWLECVMEDYPLSLAWAHPSPTSGVLWAQPVGTPVVTLAVADRPLDGWPQLEGFVQDGRYSYDGALDRANADLDAFSEPLVTAEWETDDLNAEPGRQQAIHLTGASVIDPLDLTLTITRVAISFPLRTERPRRRCTGGDVKQSTFLDLVLTDES